jgi:hypothetical protein
MPSLEGVDDNVPRTGYGVRGVSRWWADRLGRGVVGESYDGYGMYGNSFNGYGVYGSSVRSIGVNRQRL